MLPTERAEAFEVSGRGELSLAILIETMRREGYELQVSQPLVIMKTDESGKKLEPYEDVVVEADAEYSGTVIQKLQSRKGMLTKMLTNNDGSQRMEFSIPSRGLLGYRSEFLTDTRGTGVMYSNFFGVQSPTRGDLPYQRNGALIVLEKGETTTYSLCNLQERGRMFVGAGVAVYPGQVIGEHARENDLVVNPCKKKAADEHACFGQRRGAGLDAAA